MGVRHRPDCTEAALQTGAHLLGRCRRRAGLGAQLLAGPIARSRHGRRHADSLVPTVRPQQALQGWAEGCW